MLPSSLLAKIKMGGSTSSSAKVMDRLLFEYPATRSLPLSLLFLQNKTVFMCYIKNAIVFII